MYMYMFVYVCLFVFLVRFFNFLFFLQGGQQCWALWAFLAACPCTLFIDIISLCLLIGQIKMLACLLDKSPAPRRHNSTSVGYIHDVALTSGRRRISWRVLTPRSSATVRRTEKLTRLWKLPNPCAATRGKQCIP